MNGNEIRQQIDANNAKIEEQMHSSFFTLNTIVNKLLEKNKKLQEECPHQYKNGICIFCDREEK